MHGLRVGGSGKCEHLGLPPYPSGRCGGRGSGDDLKVLGRLSQGRNKRNCCSGLTTDSEKR